MTDAKRGRWVVFAYYYLAALIGLIMLVVGAVMAGHGLVRFALPETSDEVRWATEPYRFAALGPDEKGPKPPSEAELKRIREEAIDHARTSALGDMLTGVVTAAVGAPVMAWHLRQARRREPEWAVEAAPVSSPVSAPPPAQREAE